eukprot:3882301-Prymnesium_polylepis.1
MALVDWRATLEGHWGSDGHRCRVDAALRVHGRESCRLECTLQPGTESGDSDDAAAGSSGEGVEMRLNTPGEAWGAEMLRGLLGLPADDVLLPGGAVFGSPHACVLRPGSGGAGDPAQLDIELTGVCWALFEPLGLTARVLQLQVWWSRVSDDCWAASVNVSGVVLAVPVDFSLD